MRRLCVFCGSNAGTRALYRDSARQLGEAMVRRGIGLVFGGGHIGMMGIIADAVLASGGEAIGVIPKALVDKELAHQRLTALHIVDTMHQRKALMADLADGFAAMPGGFGTLEEWFEILTWAQLGMHHKPIGLLNVAGFFAPLLAWADHAVAEGFLKAKHQRLIVLADDPERLLDRMQEYRPIDEPKWIKPAER